MRHVISVNTGLVMVLGIWATSGMAQQDPAEYERIDTQTGCKAYGKVREGAPPRITLLQWSGSCVAGLFEGEGVELVELFQAASPNIPRRVAAKVVFANGRRVQTPEYYTIANDGNYLRCDPERCRRTSSATVPNWARFIAAPTGSGVGQAEWQAALEVTPQSISSVGSERRISSAGQQVDAKSSDQGAQRPDFRSRDSVVAQRPSGAPSISSLTRDGAASLTYFPHFDSANSSNFVIASTTDIVGGVGHVQ